MTTRLPACAKTCGLPKGAPFSPRRPRGAGERARPALRPETTNARRYGADPPAALTELRGAAETSLLAAAGIPPALVSMQDGTAQRESYRRFIHTTIEPLGHILAAEIERKLELPARFDFDRLTASLDLSGRARAFQSLVKGGMAAGGRGRSCATDGGGPMNEIIRVLGEGAPDEFGDRAPGGTLYELPATVRPMPSTLVGDDKAETGRQYFQITIDTTADGTPRPGS